MANSYKSKCVSHEEIREYFRAWAKVDWSEEQLASNDKIFYWNTHAGAYKIKSEVKEWLDEIDLFNELELMACAIDESGIEPHYVEHTSGHRKAIGIKFDFSKEIAGRLAECIDAMCGGNDDIAYELREDLIDVLGSGHYLLAEDEEPVTLH